MGKVYQELAQAIGARERCIETDSQQWIDKWTERIERIMETAPSGSGIDNGTILIIDKSTEERLELEGDFHHMDENGGYDGWTEHQIIVTGSLIHGFNLKIKGPDRNGIKEYLYDRYQCWLDTPVKQILLESKTKRARPSIIKTLKKKYPAEEWKAEKAGFGWEYVNNKGERGWWTAEMAPWYDGDDDTFVSRFHIYRKEGPPELLEFFFPEFWLGRR